MILLLSTAQVVIYLLNRANEQPKAAPQELPTGDRYLVEKSETQIVKQ